MNQNNMHRIKKNMEYLQVCSSFLNLDFFHQKSKIGIIYTSYSDMLNIIEVGFAENNKILETKLSKNEAILLEKKRGQKRELKLLIEILKKFGIKFDDQLNFKYSDVLMRHLSTLGWPIGKSLYKKRVIRKEISCA